MSVQPCALRPSLCVCWQPAALALLCCCPGACRQLVSSLQSAAPHKQINSKEFLLQTSNNSCGCRSLISSSCRSQRHLLPVFLWGRGAALYTTELSLLLSRTLSVCLSMISIPTSFLYLHDFYFYIFFFGKW